MKYGKEICCFLLSTLGVEIKEESVLLSAIQALLSFLTFVPIKISLVPAVPVCYGKQFCFYFKPMVRPLL